MAHEYPRELSRAEFEAARNPLPSYAAESGRDWEVTRCIDKGPGHYYRFLTEGVNRCNGGNAQFFWDVPDLCWRYYMP